ncbi:Terminal uridylyltransferase cid1 [Astathelohania contejeani]|uniref:polynucleotide adenylyltransferase n=1 Tax=Astathelohania contejeani TaxID=164912 RepID=A0ABQ7HYW4_9MICR|nr:Terminal uridylyltransferase cid1 [Thelohania contejeani]
MGKLPRTTNKLDTILYRCYRNHSLNPQDISIRYQIVKDVSTIVRPLGMIVSVIGSLASKLSLAESDIDLVCIGPDETAEQQVVLVQISRVLCESGYCIDHVLDKAATPIIKFTCINTGIHIDMSINKHSAILNTQLITKYVSSYDFIRPVIILVKIACQRFGINSSYQGTLSSYAIVLLVIFYFQSKNEIPPTNWEGKCKREVNSLYNDILGFFIFYGYVFNYDEEVVCIRNGYSINKSKKFFHSYHEKCSTNVCVEDPFILDFNVTRTISTNGLRKIITIFKIISKSLYEGDISMFH